MGDHSYFRWQPIGPTTYIVSGTLRYSDNGNNVVVQLAAVSITVLPTASLQVHYFHQRDVLSDDPFTVLIELRNRTTWVC